MAATIYTIPPFNLSFKWADRVADLKDTGREFHVELSRKKSDVNPNLHVLVGGKIRFLPTVKEKTVYEHANMSYMNSGFKWCNVLNTFKWKILLHKSFHQATVVKKQTWH